MDKQGKDVIFKSSKEYKVTEGQEEIEIKTSNNRAGKMGTIRRTGANTYIVIRTGEQRMYKVERSDEERNSGMNRKLSRLRNLIRNAASSDNSMLVTLTYSTQQQNIEAVQKDFERFIRRVRQRHKIEYIAVPELQEIGRWHIHVILIGNNNISHTELKKAWGCGGVYESPVRDIDDVAKYLTSINERKCEMRKRYPDNMRLYRCSSGVKRPETTIVNGDEVVKKVEGSKLVYHKSCRGRDGFFHTTTVYKKNTSK